MPYPAKLMNLKALLTKLEATYGTAVSLTATTDGQLLALQDRFPGILQWNWNYNGEVGPAPGNLGMLKRQGAVGRTISGSVPMRARPAGTTYAATVLPNIHTMLKISGLDSTLATGAYTYTPTADSITYSSATVEAYQRGEKWTARGVLGSVGFDITGPQIPIFTFDVNGIADTVVADSAMVAPTYPNSSVAEPGAVGITLALGSYVAPVVRSASFRMNRSIDNPRLDLTAADVHQGFAPGGYDPEFRVTIEAPALTYPHGTAGVDPYRAFLNGEDFALSLTVGGSAFNRWKWLAPQAQLKEFTPSNDGPVATWDLVFACRNSGLTTQTDAFRFVFD